MWFLALSPLLFHSFAPHHLSVCVGIFSSVFGLAYVKWGTACMCVYFCRTDGVCLARLIHNQSIQLDKLNWCCCCLFLHCETCSSRKMPMESIYHTKCIGFRSAKTSMPLRVNGVNVSFFGHLAISTTIFCTRRFIALSVILRTGVSQNTTVCVFVCIFFSLLVWFIGDYAMNTHSVRSQKIT